MTLMTVIAVALRYFTEFGKPAFQHITATARIQLTDIVVRIRCRRIVVKKVYVRYLISDKLFVFILPEWMGIFLPFFCSCDLDLI